MAWTGNSGAFIETTIDLPPAAIGSNILLRWRMGTDTSEFDTGWFIDSIQFAGIAAAAPSVVNVDSTTANGFYSSGDAILVDVEFSGAVDVTGAPRLTLETGNPDRNAVYLSGSGTSTLTFRYIVQDGNTSSDLDYVAVGSLALNGGTIVAAGGAAAANLALPAPGASGSLGANAAIVVDTTLPVVTLTFACVNRRYDAERHRDRGGCQHQQQHDRASRCGSQQRRRLRRCRRRRLHAVDARIRQRHLQPLARARRRQLQAARPSERPRGETPARAASRTSRSPARTRLRSSVVLVRRSHMSKTKASARSATLPRSPTPTPRISPRARSPSRSPLESMQMTASKFATAPASPIASVLQGRT